MPPLLTHYLQNQRLKIVAPYLHGDLLDLGCGLARITELIQPGQLYVGVEGPDAFLTWLVKNKPMHRFYQRDLSREPLELGQRFDTILLIAVIEHLKDPGFLLQQIPDLLKPGGRLLITTPSPVGDIIHRTGARLGLFSNAAAEEHEIIFDHRRLADLVESCGLRVQKYTRFLMGGNQLFICEKA